MSKTIKNLKLNKGLSEGLEIDVAVIGAGTSGLYSAYRLMTGKDTKGNALKKNVQVFEMSDRIGGRLESVVLPKMEVTGELGGMRYLNSQLIVTQLIELVFSKDLNHIVFPMGDPADLLFYLRKQRFRQNAWAKGQDAGTTFQTRYYLNDDDIGFSADQLFNKIIFDVLVSDPWVLKKYGDKIVQKSYYDYEFTLSSEDWDDIKPMLIYGFDGPYEGLKVNDIGFWNLVKDQVSEEGYIFLDEAGGYYSNTINWNAAEAFPYMVGDFSGPDINFRTIEGGYDLIAYALAYYYLKEQRGEIWIKNKLLTINRTDKGKKRYQLIFNNLESGINWNVYADEIILAMPRRSLELIDQDCFLFKDEKLKYYLESVIMEPSFKLLMGFEDPWWKSLLGAASGHSITDLPMRQCYYFGTDPKDSHSLFLASYNDMRTVTFWKALHDNHPDLFETKPTRLMSLEQMPDLENIASKVMVAEAMKEVRELHGDQKIPEPYIALYKDWADDPFGGGYHAWKAAYDIKETMEYMRKPMNDENVYICGEAYSDQQGWAEGAFCVSEKVLQEHFKLKRPEWLPESYYLGW